MLLKKAMKCVALLTALCVFLSVAAPALALDETTTVYVNPGLDKKVEGSVLIPSSSTDDYAAYMYADQTGDANLEITGDAESKWGVYAESNGGVVSYQMGGDIQSESRGFYTFIAHQGKLLMDMIKGSVIVQSVNDQTRGGCVYVEGDKYDPKQAGTATIHIAKDISVTSENGPTTGLEGESEFGSTLDFQVDGNVTAETQKNYSNALLLTTIGENSKLTAIINGNVTSASKLEYAWDAANAVKTTNKGGNLKVVVKENVNSSKFGIKALTSLSFESIALTTAEINTIKSTMTPSYEDAYQKDYSFTDENGIYHYYYENIYGTSYGYKNIGFPYAGTTSISVAGDVLAENAQENESVTGVYADSEIEDQEMDISVGGNVAVKGDVEAIGISGKGFSGTTVDIEVTGDVSAEAPNGNADGLNLSSVGEDSQVTATVDGDVKAAGSSKYVPGNSTTAIRTYNQGGSLSAEVAGNAESSRTGINASSKKYYIYQSMTAAEFAALKDKMTLISETALQKHYQYTDENGTVYNYFVNTSAPDYGDKRIGYEYAGTSRISVGGNVRAQNDGNDIAVTGINVDSELSDHQMDIQVGGDVTAEGAGFTTGIQANVYNSTLNLDISQGAVTSKSNNASAEGVKVTTNMDRDDPEAESAIAMTIGKGVEVTAHFDATGISARSMYDSSVRIDAKGDVTAEAESQRAEALIAATYGENSETAVSVDGDVKAVGNPAYIVGANSASGIVARNQGGDLTVKATGNVESNGMGISAQADLYNLIADMKAEEYEALKDKMMLNYEGPGFKNYYYIDEEGTSYNYTLDDDASGYDTKHYQKAIEGSTTVTVGGNVAVENDREGFYVTGLSAVNSVNSQKMNIAVGGDVTAKANGSANGVIANGYGAEVNIDISKGSITAVSENGSTVGAGLTANRNADDKESVLKLSVKDVTATGGGSTTGIRGRAYGSKIRLDIEGGVTAESKKSNAYAVNTFAYGYADDPESGSSFDVIIGKDVTAKGETFAHGISGNVNLGSSLNFQVKGSVSASADQSAAVGISLGVMAEGPGDVKAIAAKSKATAEVDGDVTVTGGESAIGLQATNYGSSGSVYMLVKGSVVSDDVGVWVYAQDAEAGSEEGNQKTQVTILHDVTAKGNGIFLGSAKNTEILVDGTVTGNAYPVVLDQDVKTDSLILTVWGIELDDTGAAAVRREMNTEISDWTFTEDEEFEKQIQYIIRIQQPSSGEKLYVKGADEYKGYDVAHEGDKIYLMGDLHAGNRIVKAFYDVDKTKEMSIETNNSFSMTVPRGGKLLLSALIGKIQKQLAEQPEKPVYKEQLSYDEYIMVDKEAYGASKMTVKIDGNGGAIGGKDSLTMLVKQGKKIVLPDADTREGYEFLGWYETACDRSSKNWMEPDAETKLLPAGEEVIILNKTVFTAIWQENK